MLKGIKELVDLLLLWGFIYVGSFIILIIGVVHITKSNEPPIIKQYHSHNTVQVIEPQKRVLVEREVCKDIRGCELLKGGECPDCVLEKIYE